MNSAPRLSYRARPATGAEHELGALAAIYSRAIARYQESRAEKKGVRPDAPDDAERRSNEIRAKSRIPR